MSRRNKGGRPRKITKDVLQKLEDAFSNGCTDEEACIYAGIAEKTLYNYQKRKPEFVQRKQALKQTPNIAARRVIAEALQNKDVNTAKWYLEKKDPDFKPISKVEHAGKIVTEQTMDPAAQAAVKAYEETRKKQIQEETRAMP